MVEGKVVVGEEGMEGVVVVGVRGVDGSKGRG